MASSSSKPPPEQRAAEIINNLPSSPNLVTKTGSVILGTGLLATAISQELYVVNEETVIAAGFFILISFIYKVRLVSEVTRGCGADYDAVWLPSSVYCRSVLSCRLIVSRMLALLPFPLPNMC